MVLVIFLKILSVSFVLLVAWILLLKLIKRLWKFPIPSVLTGLIDNPVRRKIQPPKTLVKMLQLRDNMILLEVGPGKGTYTFDVAKQVPNGKLIAIDIQENIVKKLNEKCEEFGITNVEARVMNVYNLNFDNEVFDRVFLISCLPEIPDPVRALEELNRVLKPSGLICLVETFPDPDYPLSRTEINWAKDAGLKLEFRHGNWFTYYLVFSKPN
jgi:ubiquinone/menaquinone biosynthesis C-methylase UbiE